MSKQYPRLVYTAPGPHECNGGTYGYELVKDEDEFQAALSVGFFPSVPEALAGKVDEAVSEEQQSTSKFTIPSED